LRFAQSHCFAAGSRFQAFQCFIETADETAKALERFKAVSEILETLFRYIE